MEFLEPISHDIEGLLSLNLSLFYKKIIYGWGGNWMDSPFKDWNGLGFYFTLAVECFGIDVMPQGDYQDINKCCHLNFHYYSPVGWGEGEGDSSTDGILN